LHCNRSLHRYGDRRAAAGEFPIVGVQRGMVGPAVRAFAQRSRADAIAVLCVHGIRGSHPGPYAG